MLRRRLKTEAANLTRCQLVKVFERSPSAYRDTFGERYTEKMLMYIGADKQNLYFQVLEGRKEGDLVSINAMRLAQVKIRRKGIILTEEERLTHPSTRVRKGLYLEKGKNWSKEVLETIKLL